MLDKIHEIETGFDQLWGGFNSGAIKDGKGLDWHIKSFFRTSLIKLLEGEIERLREEKQLYNGTHREPYKDGFNSSTKQQIAHLQSIFKDLAKPI